MSNYKRTVKFTDELRNLATIDITIKNDRFSMSADYCNGGGQCLDSIKPKTEEQKHLIQNWQAFHLEKPPSDIIKVTDHLCDAIDKEFYANIIDSNVEEEKLIKLIENENLKYDTWLYIVCIKEFDLTLDDLHQIKYDELDYLATIQGVDYLIGDDDDMNLSWDKELNYYIDECILPEMPERYHVYFDDKAFKDDCRCDGRAHSLNRYDGSESEQDALGITYYIYQQ